MDNQKAAAIKRGVSLYSFQEEYFLRKMTLEDIIATTEKLDIPGVEIIPDQMIPGYPNISDDFLKQWHGWMDKYGRTPVCMDMFLDWNKYKGRVMTEDERVESVTTDIINANKLGCGVIRVIHDVEPAVLERRHRRQRSTGSSWRSRSTPQATTTANSSNGSSPCSRESSLPISASCSTSACS